MSYSPRRQQTQNMILAENHEKIAVDAWTVDGRFVEQVVRVVMTDEGDRYVTYNRKRRRLKKMRSTNKKYATKEGFLELYILKVMPDEPGIQKRLTRADKEKR